MYKIKDICRCLEAQSSTESEISDAGSGSLSELLSPLAFREAVVRKELEKFLRAFDVYVESYTELPKYLEPKDMILEILLFAVLEYECVLTSEHFLCLSKYLDKSDNWGHVQFDLYANMVKRRICKSNVSK